MYVQKTPEGEVVILNQGFLVATICPNQSNGEEVAKSFVDGRAGLEVLAGHIRALIESSSLSRALKTDKDADAYLKARSDARLTLHDLAL